MARVVRNRNRSRTTSRGFYGSFTGSITDLVETSQDWHKGPREDSDFHLTRTLHKPVRISGVGNGGIAVYDFVPDFWIPGSMDVWHPAIPTLGAALTKVLANSNPNRRTVDMPVFLFELADIPEMIKTIGDNLLHFAKSKGRPPKLTDQVTQLAGSNLATQFGWLPLISDLGKMLDFQNIVEKRRKELERLYSKRGLRRRFNVFEDVEVLNGAATMQTSNFNAQAKWMIIRKSMCWSTIRWRPSPTVLSAIPPVVPDLQSLARRATLDIDHRLHQDIDFASIWEAIPFSWLVDYFANVGDVLKANRNQIPVTATDASVMFQLHSTCEYSGLVCVPNTLKGANGHHDYWSKARYCFPAPTPSFSASLPLLNGGQLSILGSLAVVLLMGGKPNTQL